MSIIPKLATSLNRRDEVPNQELAAEILKRSDTLAITELVENLTNKNRGLRYDCIKVLYEVGYAQPKLIAVHMAVLMSLMTSKDNRLQWGSDDRTWLYCKRKTSEYFCCFAKNHRRCG